LAAATLAAAHAAAAHTAAAHSTTAHAATAVLGLRGARDQQADHQWGHQASEHGLRGFIPSVVRN
jgi:hypothetical protein